tara:strand:- start:288 stop:557 length:270 start_codon:yes stop_codon:yes gene_type:complete
MQRHWKITLLDDDDLLNWDIDPNKISNEEFDKIAGDIEDSFNHYFTEFLHDSLTKFLGVDWAINENYNLEEKKFKANASQEVKGILNTT